MMYDLAIVGAGPAGLMAAKTAAGKGLTVVVIEKRKDISHVTRACCQQFIMDKNYSGESIQVEQGKIIFPNNGFEIGYHGPTANITDKYYVSPKGHEIHFAYEDKRPVAVKFDKGHLLNGIRKECEGEGVLFMDRTIAYAARENENGVTVSMSSRGKHSTIKAKKLIVADGANSRVADSLGIHKERTLFTTYL